MTEIEKYSGYVPDDGIEFGFAKCGYEKIPAVRMTVYPDAIDNINPRTFVCELFENGSTSTTPLDMDKFTFEKIDRLVNWKTLFVMIYKDL